MKYENAQPMGKFASAAEKGTISPTCVNRPQGAADLGVEGKSITFKLDTGASCNILPIEHYQRIWKTRQRLYPGPRVKTYTGQQLKVVGRQSLLVLR